MIPIGSRMELRRILSLAAALEPLEDGELKRRMQALRGQDTKKVRPEADALVYEALRRRLSFTPYPEQVLGAIAMAEGCVAQMNTGEGKTVTAVFPGCL